MRTSIDFWDRRLWLLALALPLALLLAACSASQPTVAPVVTATNALVSASPGLPTAPLAPATATAAPTVAVTAAPTLLAPTKAAPAATLPPTGPAATATTPDPAVAAVLAYLDARAQANVAAVTSLSCKTWKAKAVTEAVSFRSMNAKLVGVTCQVNGSAGSFTLVGCGGKMVTTYGTESRDWDLSTFVYQVTAEDGQWKMCGYH
jgi:hypothetical protein